MVNELLEGQARILKSLTWLQKEQIMPHNLMSLLEGIEKLVNKEHIVGCLLEFYQSLDKVYHSILLEKTER